MKLSKLSAWTGCIGAVFMLASIFALWQCWTKCWTNGIFLMNDSEKANYLATYGRSEKDIQQLKIKFFSRDLALCQQRTQAEVLSKEALYDLSSGRAEKILAEEAAAQSQCLNTLQLLATHIETAQTLKIRHQEIYRLLQEGQELSHDHETENVEGQFGQES